MRDLGGREKGRYGSDVLKEGEELGNLQLICILSTPRKTIETSGTHHFGTL